MTGSWFDGLRKTPRPRVASSFPTRPRRSPCRARSIAVGPGARDDSGKLVPLDVKAGDYVLFGKWSGTEVKIDGTEYLIMKESDIMGVLEDRATFKKAA